jgi:hypothetical protein
MMGAGCEHHDLTPMIFLRPSSVSGDPSQMSEGSISFLPVVTLLSFTLARGQGLTFCGSARLTPRSSRNPHGLT